MAQPAPTKTIIILGGSYGGVSTAHYLLKHIIPELSEKDTYEIIVVSASSEALDRPACPRAMISDDMFPQEKLFVSIQKQFAQYPKSSFRFIHGTATALDHTNRTVTINNTEKLDFYALVIATGASTPSPLMGLNAGEDSLRRNWAEFREALPNAKSIVVAGGGPAGNKILPLLRESLAAKAEAYLANVGVTVVKNTKVESVEPADAGLAGPNLAKKTTLKLSDGKTLEADIYIPTTGMTPNTSFVDKALLTDDGRVEVNEYLRAVKAGPRVYAVGDVGSAARPAIHNILNVIPILCANIKRDLLLAEGKEGKAAGEDRTFKEDKREMQLVPIGKSKGVGAAMGWAVPSVMVWAIKGRDYWLWTLGRLWSGNQWNKAS